MEEKPLSAPQMRRLRCRKRGPSWTPSFRPMAGGLSGTCTICARSPTAGLLSPRPTFRTSPKAFRGKFRSLIASELRLAGVFGVDQAFGLNLPVAQ
jgi:hypothetical protein